MASSSAVDREPTETVATAPKSERPQHKEFGVYAIRIRGTVQGVGFRPAVWRIARELGLVGDVANDAEGVLVRVWGAREQAQALIERIEREAPRLASIDSVEMQLLPGLVSFDGFSIIESASGAVSTQVVPDAAICPECLGEILDPRERRHQYPFTNCTNCGPRLTIVERIPYDRAHTSMAKFAMCAHCRAEYENPSDRRFHAQPIACPACGPQVRLITLGDSSAEVEGTDAIATAITLLKRGAILAIKGIGGYHLACDARDREALTRLRTRKRRFGKPFALMARDIDVIRCYARVGNEEAKALTSSAAPIVLLDTSGFERLPDSIAPGLRQLGFMLPYSPLHHLLLQEFDGPLVMTSGNVSDEPQCADDGDALQRLAGIAGHFLVHDRRIVNRIDDSVVQIVAGKLRLVRRARGFAPSPIELPAGFERAPAILAMGGELKSVFCLSRGRHAVLSAHHGDLENAPAFTDFERNLDLFARLYEHEPVTIAIDRHPDYLSSKKGAALAQERNLVLVEVQHHHAHVAACMAENSLPLDAAPVLGIVLDGLGLGDDGTIWGGEFLLADYLGYERLACLKPVAMPGGARAVLEPWRNLVAHLEAAMGYATFEAQFGATPLATYLRSKPIATLAAMMANGLNSPLASSCGRLFDAVAAALGICADAVGYEGEAAMRLEAALSDPLPSPLASPAEQGSSKGLVFPARTGTAPVLAMSACRRAPGRGRKTRGCRSGLEDGYPFAATPGDAASPAYLDPAPMWQRLCEDLRDGVPAAIISRRFHDGLAGSVADLAIALAGRGRRFAAVALSGGCLQNRFLTEALTERIRSAGLDVLLHARVPPNDGGLALGQAAVAAARLVRR